MFSAEILAAYLAAAMLVVLAPGPDNVLAISRGLSQGRPAAALSAPWSVDLITDTSHRNDPYAIAALAVAVIAYLFHRAGPLLGLCNTSCLLVHVISACGGLAALGCGLFARQPERMEIRSGRDLALIGVVLGAYLFVAPLLSRGIGLLFSLTR